MTQPQDFSKCPQCGSSYLRGRRARGLAWLHGVVHGTRLIQCFHCGWVGWRASRTPSSFRQRLLKAVPPRLVTGVSVLVACVALGVLLLAWYYQPPPKVPAPAPSRAGVNPKPGGNAAGGQTGGAAGSRAGSSTPLSPGVWRLAGIDPNGLDLRPAAPAPGQQPPAPAQGAGAKPEGPRPGPGKAGKAPATPKP